MRSSMVAVCLLAAGMTASTAAQAREGALSLQETQLDLTVARFEGDYGLDETTRYDVLSAGLRWYFPRFELQVNVPWVSLSGPGDIRVIGGQPVPGFGGFRPGLPGRPPGLPGGGSGGSPGEEIVEVRRESGLGDISLQAEVYLLQGSDVAPWVTGLARVKTPTGDEDRGLGTGETDFELGLGVVQPFGRASLFADTGYTWIGKGDSAGLRDVLRVGAGASLALDDARRNSVSVYLENRSNAVRGLEDQRTLSAGFSSRLGAAGRLRMTVTGYAGLSDSSEDWGAALRLGYRL